MFRLSVWIHALLKQNNEILFLHIFILTAIIYMQYFLAYCDNFLRVIPITEPIVTIRGKTATKTRVSLGDVR